MAKIIIGTKKVIIKKRSNLTPKLIGEAIGGYSDGDVFYYGKDKIIKFSGPWTNKTLMNKFVGLLEYIKQNNPNFIVKVFDWGIIKNNIIYYIMEKLYRINARDASFSGIIHEFVFDDIRPDGDKLDKIDTDWYGKPITRTKLNFVKDIFNFKYENRDIHSENVMRNRYGKLKLIDLESFIFENWNHRADNLDRDLSRE